MKSKQNRLSTLFTWALASVCFSAIVMGQEKEKPPTGSAVETWRQSLPPEAETQKPIDENGDTQSLPANDETHRTILSLEQGWIDAIRVGDADSLSQLLSGDFVFVSSRTIHVTNRNQYLEHAIRNLRLTSSELEKLKVRVFGRTAIVGGVLKQKGSVKGEDVGGSYLFTDVWINRGGTWRVVSRHESQLPPQK